ncbi:MAG TPA: transglycosylase SLT domain-containing protein [Roseomonas sp.]|nr:transglycosylase SLT domain-containing protein [Roseomonas sp.]
MSGSIFDRERLRPTTTVTQVAGLPGRPMDRAAPVRAPDPVAPNAPTPIARPKPSDDLASLAAALSGLSPILNGAADLWFKGQRQEDAQNADADATALAIKGQVSTWSQAVKDNPALADRSPFYRQIFEDRLAREAVIRKGNQLHGEYWGSELAGSADPAAIQKWLTGNMKDILDQFQDSPAQRAAAAEELRNQAHSLVRTHQQNAVKNLVAQNEDSLSRSASAAFDTYSLRTGGSSSTDAAFAVPDDIRRVYEKVAKEEGVPAALLIAQGYHESGGFASDVLSGKKRGSKGEIGLAQVLPSTASAPGYGLDPIDEKGLLDPEKAIRFQARYLKARGSAAGVKDWTDPRQAMIGLAAYNGVGEQAQGYARTVFSLAEQARGSTSGPVPGAGPNPYGLAAELQRIEAEARAQGVDGRTLNKVLTQATVAAMIRHGRVDFADLGLMPRPDGTPGFASTAEGRIALENAKNTVLSKRVQDENIAYTRHVRARELAGETLASSVAQTLVEQLAAGETPKLTPDQLRIAARVDPGLIRTFSQLADSLQGVKQTEDTRDVAELELRVNTGEATIQDVRDALGVTIKDPQTIRRLMQKALEVQSSDNVFRNSAVTQIIRETQEAAAGMEGSGVLKDYSIGVTVGNAMREEAAEFARKNPAATQAELIAHLRQKQKELVPKFNSDVDLQGAERKASGAAPAPKQEEQKAALTVEPNPSVNTQRVAVFGSLQELETAFSSWRQNPTATSGPGIAIARWIIEGGVQDVGRFYDQQKKLLQAQGQNTNSR